MLNKCSEEDRINHKVNFMIVGLFWNDKSLLSCFFKKAIYNKEFKNVRKTKEKITLFSKLSD